MTGSPSQPSSGATPPKPAPNIRALGRWHKWATLIVLLGGFAIFGVAWFCGFVKFD